MIEATDGLHYLQLPDLVDHIIRGMVFILSAIVAGVSWQLIVMMRRIEHPHFDNFLIGAGICLFAVRTAVVQIERWDVPVPLEGPPVTIVILLLFAWGIRRRVMAGRFGT